MNFSIVMPSRGEIEPLIKTLDSFERTTKDKKNLEFLIALDEDKYNVLNVIRKKHYTFYTQCYLRPKTKDFVRDYYNWLADRTIGKNIMAFNDDAWMRTNHWDKKILNKINEYDTSIYLLDIPDTARIKYRNGFPCFPMVSRRGMCTVGGLFTTLVRMYPADKIIYEVYKNVNRIIKVDNVLIEHEHTQDYSGDKKELFDILKEDKLNNATFDISPYINRLSKVCENESMKQSKLRRIINILKEK